MDDKLRELLKNRDTEEYLASSRNTRTETLSEWKGRIEEADELIRGNIGYRNPDGVAVSSPMMVMNLADQVPRDIARLTSENEPSYIATSYGDDLKDDQNAVLRSVIGRGYFESSNFDLMRPQLAMDISITGTYFYVLWVDSSSPYPRLMRLDPRFCYPDVYNGEIQDLLAIQKVKRRVAQRQFPDIDFRLSDRKISADSEVEIIDYYGPEFCLKAVTTSGGSAIDAGDIQILSAWTHEVDRVPAVFQQLPSPDGAFRGMMDQIGPSLGAKNRAVNLILEYAHEGIYAPFEEKGILNPTDPPGPNTIYRHNPSATESFMRRMAPASFNPQLFGLVQYLDTEERGQLAYPTTRQGEVSQSQGSASFVTATQGQLTSIVREVQRMMAHSQEQAARIAFQLDEHHLNFEKPLIHSVGKKETYVPQRDIKGRHGIQVAYGAGAGLDRMNADQRLLNFFSAGVLSAETMLNQTDFIPDATTELERRENEELARVILQRFSADPSISLDFINRVYEIKRDTGVTLVEAYSRANAEQQTAQPELPAQPGAEVPPGEAAPAETPAGAPVAPLAPFSPQPLQQVLNRI